MNTPHFLRAACLLAVAGIVALPFFPALPVSAQAGKTGSALSEKEAAELVDLHNALRKEVGAPPVAWSAEIARFAQDWADYLARTGKFEHRPAQGKNAQKYGENLATHISLMEGAKLWAQEKPLYPGGAFSPSMMDAAHYTQMVWSNTQRIGVGKAKITKGQFKGNWVIVCNYDPRGNVVGQKPY